MPPFVDIWSSDIASRRQSGRHCRHAVGDRMTSSAVVHHPNPPWSLPAEKLRRVVVCLSPGDALVLAPFRA